MNVFNINPNIDINEYRKHIMKKISENSKITVCCVCNQRELPNLKRKKLNRFVSLFSNELKYLKCKHAFHSNCNKNKSCIVCESL